MAGIIAYVLIALLGPLLGFAVHRLVRTRPSWARPVAGTCLALLLLRAVFIYRPDLEWLLLPGAWYIWVQPWWVFPLGIAFFAAALPTLTDGWKRLLVQTLAVILWGSGLGATLWLVRQHPLGQDRAPRADHHLRQSTGWTCGPTAAAMLLSYWGVPATEQEMARLCLTKGGDDPVWLPGAGTIGPGTSYFGIYRGLVCKLDGLPLRARIARLDADTLATLGLPAIAGDFHARLVYGTPGLPGTEPAVVVHDPLGGRVETASMAYVRSDLAGTVVLIEPIDGARPLPPAEPRSPSGTLAVPFR